VNDTQEIIQRSSAEMLSPEYLPTPNSIGWEREGLTVKALYFTPSNKKFTADGPPPVIVNVHGGPTSQQYVRYNPTAAYFTSRGYGWVELNYRGSTGYGRCYREALRGVWGKTDTEDAVDCAAALIQQGLADPEKIIIAGGSAGGYTVLNVLVNHPGVFAAGIDKYGVSDLFALAQETHKFELHYTDLLVGVLPDDAQKYRDWSPLNHAEKIQRSCGSLPR
jgi:dipeptidyl aminopeptidase/acylaminoacyl peptidase